MRYFTILISLAAWMTAQNPQPPTGVTITGTGTLLVASDLTCAGLFTTPGSSQSGSSINGGPVAYRYEVDGKRHYFTFTGDGHVKEFPEPTLSACNTALTSANRATYESWGGDWGTLTFQSGRGPMPAGGCPVFGMFYDQTLNELVFSWSCTYVGLGSHNTIGAVTLNDTTHTMSIVGCWAVTGHDMPTVGSGVLEIPSTFVGANLPAGSRWGVGFGEYFASATNETSMGPMIQALPPPSTNSCVAGVDNFISAGKVIWGYGNNSVGPTCVNIGLGCTPPQAPTTPLHAQTAYSTYSQNVYANDWDPWQGHGWWVMNTFGAPNWYKDTKREGIVVPYITQSGWMNTTVSTSPAPTIDSVPFYPVGTMTLPTIDTHGGTTLSVDDQIWVESCTVGVDCSAIDPTANMRNFAVVLVTAVNISTRLVTYEIRDPDYGTGSHKAVIGGHVYMGALYAHGNPTVSRGTLRLSIYDPAQLAEVARGQRQSYDVIYHEDIDWNTMVPGFGSPALGTGVQIDHAPRSTLVDPTHHQILVSYALAPSDSPYSVSNAVYVFNVRQ